MRNTILLLGPPGCGKGTQALLLSQELGFVHFDIGSAFRRCAKEDSPLGRKIKSYIDAGKLVPIDIVKSFVEEFFAKHADKSIVLDGFPRSVEQAKILDEILESFERKLDLVIVFEIDDKTMRERTLGRLTCQRCGSIYNLKTNPPAKDEICDICGQALIRRKDDSAEVLIQRARVWLETTSALINLYSQKSIVHRIDATKDINSIFENLKALIFGGDEAHQD